MKKGFTLAEVLITLAIIGVVAALTIPTVIKKVQDNQLKTAFKKTYSNMQQMAEKIKLIDFGGIVGCYYGTSNVPNDFNDCPLFFDTLAKNIKYIKYCNGNALMNGCLPQYETFTGQDAWDYTMFNDNSRVWILNDGMILIAHPYRDGDRPFFAIDINGLKKPNRAGYDLFDFRIDYPLQIKGATKITPATGGRTTEQMFKYSFQ